MLFFGIKFDAFAKLKITTFGNLRVIRKSLRKIRKSLLIFGRPRISLCVSDLTADHYFWCSGGVPGCFEGVPGYYGMSQWCFGGVPGCSGGVPGGVPRMFLILQTPVHV